FPQWDTDLFVFLNGYHNPFFDMLMWYISKTSVLIVLFAFVLFAVYKKRGFIPTLFVFLGLALCILLADRISSGLFKPFFERLRPTHALGNVVHIVRNYMGGKYGFVSSHAANVFSISIFLMQVFRNKFYSCSLMIVASIVAYSRIYLGVHYPLDVICGAILGAMIGYLVSLLYYRAVATYMAKGSL
ncbi:MAG: phosphatase PAP2 family protein, partial [Bacteroidales bacterium]